VRKDTAFPEGLRGVICTHEIQHVWCFHHDDLVALAYLCDDPQLINSYHAQGYYKGTYHAPYSDEALSLRSAIDNRTSN